MTTIPTEAARTLEARHVPLGGVRGVFVDRTLPHRDLPTVGAWCFVDHFGPSRETMNVLPHPHTGLQTVTWPLKGEIRHRDSLGSNQVLRPGELNLMTAGAGVSHSEFGVVPGGESHGLQLWTALPEASRHGPAGFEHHADLPVTDGRGWQATVFMGELDGVTSPATVHSPLMGAQVTITDDIARIPLRPDWEYAFLGIDGPVMVEGVPVAHGDMRYVPPGFPEATLRADRGRQVLMLGGEPFGEDIVMWWNFIGRSHDEIVEFHDAWNAAAGGLSARFGLVDGHDGQWIPAPPLPNVNLRPRSRRF